MAAALRRGMVRPKQLFDFFLVLDFEATCERGGKILPIQEIIEFPVVKVDSSTLALEATFHRYVKPVERPELTPFCTELTGIIQEMVENCNRVEEVLSELDRWMTQEIPEGKSFCFVTCGDWDLKVMLPSEAQAKNIPLPSYFNQWINIKKSFCEKNNKFPRGIRDMLSHYGIRHEGRLHSGIDDVKNICSIVRALVESGHILSPHSNQQESRRSFSAQWNA